MAKGHLQRRDLAADRSLPADGARRRRDGDTVVIGRTHSGARAARLAEQEKSRFGIGHGHVQHGADRDRLWALLPWVGNRTALDELDPPRRRLFAVSFISGSYFLGQTRPALTLQAGRQVLTSATKRGRKKEPGGSGPPDSSGGTPNAGTGRRRSPPSTSAVAGRSGYDAEFQISRKPIFQTPKRSRTAAQRAAHIIDRKHRLHLG